MARATGGTVFGTPDRGKDSPTRTQAGRRCAEPGCPTVLSTYNQSRTCYLHTAPSLRTPLQRY